MNKTQEELKQAEEAAAKALAAKSLEEELNLEAPKAGEESIETLRARAEKAEAERENYKKAFLKAKNAKGEGSEGEEEEEGEEEDKSLDVEKIASNAATQVIEKANEKTAISQFTSQYPALKDPTAWAKVVENYVPRAGKLSVESIKADLEAALLLAKHYGGGKVADKEISLNKYASVSHAGSIAAHESQQELSSSSIEMARNFGHSVEELKAASEEGAHEIRIA